DTRIGSTACTRRPASMKLGIRNVITPAESARTLSANGAASCVVEAESRALREALRVRLSHSMSPTCLAIREGPAIMGIHKAATLVSRVLISLLNHCEDTET